MSEKILCACGGICEGVCRENHLDRKRLEGTKQEFVICPSAYTKLSKEQISFHTKHKGDDDEKSN